MLPRELSRPPHDCKNPDRYQEPLGDPCATWDEARALLDASLPKLRAHPTMGRGPSLLDYVREEIQAKHQQARCNYDSAARANRDVSTWRSIERRWLVDAPFASRAPTSIGADELQRFVNWLVDEAEGKSGEPLSSSFIRNVAALIRAGFDRVVGLSPNPAGALVLPPKGTPKVPFLALDQQRTFFGAPTEKIARRDLVRVGCGFGAGLRVGELLAFEPGDVHAFDPAPHLIVRFGGAGHAPTKSRRVRRVELFEPGLGFWRLWMKHYYRPGDRPVFEVREAATKSPGRRASRFGRRRWGSPASAPTLCDTPTRCPSSRGPGATSPDRSGSSGSSSGTATTKRPRGTTALTRPGSGPARFNGWPAAGRRFPVDL